MLDRLALARGAELAAAHHERELRAVGALLRRALEPQVLLLEALAGAVEEGLDGGVGDAHDPGDRRVREALQLAQGQHHALPFGQLLGHLPHQLAQAAHLQRVLGMAAAVAVGDLQHRLLGVAAALVDVRGAPVAPAQLVLADVDRDAVDPGPEVEALVDARQRADHVVEGLLHQVLGERLVADVAQAHGAHPGVVPLEEDVEGSNVPRQVRRDQSQVVGSRNRASSSGP